jgi:hypothetical protein
LQIRGCTLVRIVGCLRANTTAAGRRFIRIVAAIGSRGGSDTTPGSGTIRGPRGITGSATRSQIGTDRPYR